MRKVIYKNNKFYINQIDFQSLNSKGFGNKYGEIYFLSHFESLFLLEKNKIKVFQNKKELDFEKLFTKIKINLIDYIVYKDLKLKGYLVQSGLKYGVSFRIYDKGIKLGEDHSLWLIEPILETKIFKAKDLLGKNRIAHSANKKLILAIVDNENSITYLESSWKRL